MSAASSGVARGIIPGSLKLVRNKVAMTKRKMRPSATGIAGDTLTAKYGQLDTHNAMLHMPRSLNGHSVDYNIKWIKEKPEMI